MAPRLLVLSDIHGNLPALEAVLADARQFAPFAAVLVAGDFITPLYEATLLQKLRDMDAVMIQGNGEHSLLQMKDGSAPHYFWTAQQFAVARYSYACLAPADFEYLRTLPEQRVFHLPGTDPIRIVHGSPRKINESIFLDHQSGQLREVLALVDEPVVIFGHTHLAWQARVDGRLALNPGAVCGPLEGYPGARYAILEWDGGAWQATLRSVGYDLEAITQKFKESGLLETGSLARAFLASIYTGNNFGQDFVDFAFDLSRQSGNGHLPYVPDEIWQRAGETFPWPTCCP